ncbi:MAG: His/Gly/Thr/Pro-type tRNA ligase C-terminal domain-containing protein [Candidatus Berkelbacteria bacterium]|nr:His/Gly/Thr/Pro-type tRNA ligase C-terminal domain-containing protein [Candidatus Berkelbacteria bacterium]
MKLSELFTKTSKQMPSDEQSVSAQLLERAGYINKEAAGVYSLLPLGLRVINNITNIIRQEMDAVGGQEILMSGLIPKSNLEQTGRWESFEALYRLKGADDKEYGLGATHEEIISPLVKKYVQSYRDLPVAIYQIQDKFRNEIRAKSGVLRTREFLMKDLYSFHADQEGLDKYYEQVKEAYWKIFERCVIKDKTYLTLASGGTFSKYSHEFQTETEAGEDEIYVCKSCRIGLNKEILEGEYECPECKNREHEVKKTIEVGNIFKLGTKYSKPFELNFVDQSGKPQPVIMGCYGIGLQRLMGAIVEVYHDEKGIVWPNNEIAPFVAHLIELKVESGRPAELGMEGPKGKGQNTADEIYNQLLEAGIEVLYDDREDISAGEKFADADLLGIPCRLVISEKTGDKVEIKNRSKDQTELVPKEELISKLRT